MKVNSIILMILFFNFYSCSDDKKIEEAYQDCVYSSLSDGGEAYRQFMKGFENHLIDINILEDNGAKSYYNICRSIANGKKYPSTYAYSYIDSINSIEREKINPYNKECIKKVSSDNTFNTIKSALKFNNIRKEDVDIPFSELMKKFLLDKTVEDFELDFYRHRTFIYLYFSEDILFSDEHIKLR